MRYVGGQSAPVYGTASGSTSEINPVREKLIKFAPLSLRCITLRSSYVFVHFLASDMRPISQQRRTCARVLEVAYSRETAAGEPLVRKPINSSASLRAGRQRHMANFTIVIINDRACALGLWDVRSSVAWRVSSSNIEPLWHDDCLVDTMLHRVSAAAAAAAAPITASAASASQRPYLGVLEDVSSQEH